MNDTTPRPERAVTLQPRRPRAILGTALDLYYRRHPGTLIALVAVWLVPMAVLNWRADHSRTQGSRIMVLDGVVVSTSWWATIAWVVLLVLLLVVVAVFLALITRAITARLTGEDAGLRQTLRSARTRPGSLLQVAVLVVGAPAALTLLFLPGILLSGLDGPLPQLAVVANIIVIAVAGLYVGVRLAASIPAVVVEGRSWRHALSRSWSLVDGHWSHVLATLFLAFLAVSLIGTLINLFIGSLVGMLAGDDWLARTLVQAAINALTLPYFLTVWVLLYLDLRARQEPLDLDTLRADLQALEA
jgi:hypothetical protein